MSMPSKRSVAQNATRANMERTKDRQRSDRLPEYSHQSVSLSGRTVLITGGARRVGATLARTLHAAGANIVIHYLRSSSDAVRLAKDLNDNRPRSAALVQADLLDTA